MDDLLGEDWQASSKPTTTVPLNPTPPASAYSSFRPSPQPASSGIASPPTLSRPGSTVNGSAKPSNDSFSNLFTPKVQKAGNHISIQERQKQLLDEKRKQQEQQARLWDNLGSGRGTPELRGPSPAAPPPQESEDDILAAFNKAAPVDNASHFPPPPPSGKTSGKNTPAPSQSAPLGSADSGGFDDDDDPFGLGSVPKQRNGRTTAHSAAPQPDEDDDILGELGKPVSERPAPKAPSQAAQEADAVFQQMQASANVSDEPEDRSLAELVEMGFPADTAKIALAETGGDVQNAVGWLLLQAHEASRQKVREEERQPQPRRQSPTASSRSPRRQRGDHDGGSMPSWMQQERRSGSANRAHDGRDGEKDTAQMAQELGNRLFKGANSLWKASQKQMAKTISDFQQERDPSQPKWMHDTSADSSRASSQRRPGAAPSILTADSTDEAAMLDMHRETRPTKPQRPSAFPAESPARAHSPAERNLPSRPGSQPKLVQPKPLAQHDRRPASKLSRQEVEDQSAQAYVSPARRRRPTPQPEPPAEPEVDLFSSPAPVQPARTSVAPNAKAAQTPVASRPSSALPKPKAPPRNIPSVSPSALSASAHHRKAGGEAFKRGDYAAAHESYTAALKPLPATHPIMIIVLSNRSLTALKTGDAKTAVSDAERALEIIGTGQGAGESIDLGAGDGTKDMKEFYGKALMRKAEALEHMEKWPDAASVWRRAVEAGVGGAVSLRGRDRCEKAATPKPPPIRSSAPAPRKFPPAKGLGSSEQRPTLSSVSSAEAVKKLREANAAAEKVDDEKFALADQVDSRLTTWKGGKADNLRALLQSLDSVLWEGAGWKKVGMSDLVMPNKVKIIYMKAIAKVHPDKIPQDATTEQRMVSAAVFSTLNEAWDKFKKDNNL